jgi:hypothetical protein
MTKIAPPELGSANGSVISLRSLRTGNLIGFAHDSNGSNVAATDTRTEPYRVAGISRLWFFSLSESDSLT